MRKTGEDPRAAKKAGTRAIQEAKAASKPVGKSGASARQVGQALLISSFGKRLHKRGWASV